MEEEGRACRGEENEADNGHAARAGTKMHIDPAILKRVKIKSLVLLIGVLLTRCLLKDVIGNSGGSISASLVRAKTSFSKALDSDG